MFFALLPKRKYFITNSTFINSFALHICDLSIRFNLLKAKGQLLSMSQVKKVKKVKKGMSPQARRNVANGFKSIISNQACIDSAKESPWWIAIIFLAISIFLPVIPIWSNASKAYGSSFLQTTYNSDRGVFKTFEAFKAEDTKFEISGSLMTFYEPSGDVTKPWKEITDERTKMDYMEVKDPDNVTCTVINFITVIVPDNQVAAKVQELANTQYLQYSTTPWEESFAELGKSPYIPSFLVLGRSTLGMATYKYQSNARVGASSGGLTYTKAYDGDLIARVLGDTSVPDKIEQSFVRFKGFMDQTYLEVKDITVRNTVLLYLGVYLGLALILGLMIFLLTRGKNNPFRYLNFFVTQRIAWWALFTPALLGMIFGFILSGNIIGQMAFIVLASLRIMWLSMRQLRPAY